MRARMALLRAKREAALRSSAAAVLQSGVRMWIARKKVQAAVQGITRLQVRVKGMDCKSTAKISIDLREL